MDLVVTGGVVHGGTFNANTTSIAAGLAVLDALDGAAYARIDRAGTRLMAALAELGPRHAVPLHVQGLPSVFNTSFGAQHPIRDAAGYGSQVAGLQARFLAALQDHGVRPTARGTWFVSAAHDDDAIDRTIAAADHALAAIASR